MSSHRSGFLLIIVVALAALLSVLAITALLWVKTDTQAARLLIQDAQVRTTLTSALHFICETSRLGWGSEARGWVDVRTGAPGPLGPSRNGSGPQKLGWNDGGPWPAPGSAFRGDLYCVKRPRYAIDPRYAPNPVAMPASFPSVGGKSATEAAKDWFSMPPQRPYDNKFNSWAAHFNRHWWDILAVARPTGAGDQTWGPLIERPLATNATDFQAGDLQPLPESQGLTWFRIYRESRSDHDGDGTPWYDTTDFTDGSPNGYHDAGIFIVTVAAGGTRGFRFWSGGQDFLGPGNGPRTTAAGSASPQVEPMTAEGSGLFVGAGVFQALRAQERIAWYRVRWSPRIGGKFNPVVRSGGTWPTVGDEGASFQRTPDTGPIENLVRSELGIDANIYVGDRASDVILDPESLNFSVHQGGSIVWIERLDREPPVW